MPRANIDADLDLYYDIDDFTDPWKSPETIVLHHGNCKSSRFWYAWVPLLARRYRVVRLDARGYGQSKAPPPGYKWSLSGFAADLKRLLDYLGLDKVHLVGETVGGTIGMQFAYEYPERLRSLTVCSSPFRFTDSHYMDAAEKQEKMGLLAWARESMSRRLDPSQVDPAFVEWYASEMARTPLRMPVETHRVLAGQDLSDVLRQIRVPTLILTPEERPGYTPHYVNEMQQLIPNAELVAFPGVSGFVQHSHPEKCVEALLAFLERLPQA
ncbi:MAG: alpha/beta hydrolase [Chloroflexi bacterium]|nr:alpha/beta hydrolase [Chloroflexota bacterium]